LRFNATWPLRQKDHQQTIDAARRNWQAEVETAQTTAISRNVSATKNAEAFFCAWQKRKSVTRTLGSKATGARCRGACLQGHDWAPSKSVVEQDRRSRNCHSPYGATEERQEAEFRDQAERAFAGEQDVQEFLRKTALEEKAHARV